MRTGGKLNETLLVPFTGPSAPRSTALRPRMIRHGKAPSPSSHRIKKLNEVKALLKNVKETI